MITLYSTGCPKCRILQKKLDAACVPYTVIADVDEMLQMGIESVPVLKVGDDLLSFEKAVLYADRQKEIK